MKADDETSTTCSASEAEASSCTPIVKAEDWFARGRRVPYDPKKKRILRHETPNSVNVWERVVAPYEVCGKSRWLTLLPGVPDGTYTFSKVDDLLQTAPRLYVEFVGLGDSDKPQHYAHSVNERANLVEAQWRAHKIRRTVLICQSCSSVVMMELLQRQRKQLSLGLPVRTRIEHVLCLNGAYFAHTHTPHPLNTCIGKVAIMKAAQHSNIVLEPILKALFSKDYAVTKEELREISTVVRRHKGMNYFTGSASRYVEDHKKHADRWDLVNIYNITRKQGISFMIVGGEKDRFENKSFALAESQLNGKCDMYFERLPGGYNLAFEHPHRVADLIDGIAMAPAFDQDISWECHASYASKRSSMASSSDGNSTQSTATSSFSLSNSSDGWADMAFPEIYEYSI